MDVVVVAAVVEVFVRRARDFVVKFAEDFVCQHRNELPLTEHWLNNTVLFENCVRKERKGQN